MENRKQLIPEFGPFAGMRVLSAGSLVAMPFAAQLLAEFSAEVIHIERPGIGDTFRVLPPYSTKAKKLTGNCWGQDGRNRLSLTLDLNMNKPGVKKVFLELIKNSDVFMENLVWLDKLGIKDEELMEANPKLVIAHVSGYGRPAFGGDPAICDRASYDLCGQAFSGYLYLNGDPEASAPNITKPYLNDYVAGLFCLFGVLAAYFSAQKTGVGQVVDVAQFEAQARLMCDSFVTYSENGVIPERSGNNSKTFQPFGLYKDKNGADVAIGAFGEAVYKRFMKAADLDIEYFTHKECSEGKEAMESPKGKELDAAIKAWCASKTAEEIEIACAAHKVPAAKANTVKDCYENKHFNDRNDFVTYKDETDGREIKAFGIVPKLSGTPGKIWRGLPKLGQDTDVILKEIAGCSDDEIEALRNNNVI